eukprot:TRINITY_DN66941_c2_g3_i3.p1 TRINITY_DN66941_c2_g3~~TRINITY_DN66941_c2_g3_i3.p1  ORF type:complete len:161 (-),score=18.35 TRINITY_DN66941_c2_g3_i3:71-553(-)
MRRAVRKLSEPPTWFIRWRIDNKFRTLDAKMDEIHLGRDFEEFHKAFFYYYLCAKGVDVTRGDVRMGVMECGEEVDAIATTTDVLFAAEAETLIDERQLKQAIRFLEVTWPLLKQSYPNKEYCALITTPWVSPTVRAELIAAVERCPDVDLVCPSMETVA